MSLTAIKDVQNYKKDEVTGAIVSTDRRGLQAYKKSRQSQSGILNDINNIKQELGELKDMLNLIISSQKGN
jgi:hypothetical protein|tara:strand:- start:514 stop:726 length:213 start_codon:yes stop_codon:yes gene_type:complete